MFETEYEPVRAVLCAEDDEIIAVLPAQEPRTAKARGVATATAKGSDEFSSTISAGLTGVIASSPDVTVLGDISKVAARARRGILVGECTDPLPRSAFGCEFQFEDVTQKLTAEIRSSDVVVIGRHNHEFEVWFDSLLDGDVEVAGKCAALIVLNDFSKAGGGYAQAVREAQLSKPLPVNFLALSSGLGFEDTLSPGGIQLDLESRPGTAIETVGSTFMRALARVCAFNPDVPVNNSRRYFGAALVRTICGSTAGGKKPFSEFFAGPKVGSNVTTRMALGWADIPFQRGACAVARLDRGIARGREVAEFLGSKSGAGPDFAVPPFVPDWAREVPPHALLMSIEEKFEFGFTQDNYFQWRDGSGPMPAVWRMDRTLNALVDCGIEPGPDQLPFYAFVLRLGDDAVAAAVVSAYREIVEMLEASLRAGGPMMNWTG